MKTRLNTFRLGQKLGAGGWGQTAAFTLVELLVVIAIVALLAGAILPAVGSFFDTARGPNARNLISASLTNARNYAVANNIRTALVFVEDDDDDGTRRTLVFLAEHDGSGTLNFAPVAGREAMHLPDEIIVSSDNGRDDEEDAVAICFLPVGQLTTFNINEIELPDPPGGTIPNVDVNVIELPNLWFYDTVDSDSAVEEVLINYYSGAVIEE